MPFTTVSFRTAGCRLNQAETGIIAAQFADAGFRVLPDGDVGDIAVVHSCTITRQAERDCLRLARRLRREGARLIIVAGCAVEHDAAAVAAAAGADLLAGQRDKFRLPAILAARGIGAVAAPHASPAGDAPARTPLFHHRRAVVKLQDGCDFGCAYCIVPATRGAPTSRPLIEVVDEVRRLADRGYREVVLTGANLGCYADGPRRLADALPALAAVSGIERLRLSSMELSTAEREVIDCMAASHKICRFLHVPLQSGDDAVLSRMGRRYTAAAFRAFVEYAAERVPGIGLGTDAIVGLPGEDRPAFERSFALIDALPFSNLHVFAYSKRPGTRAARMPDQVSACDKRARSAALIALGDAKRRAYAASWVGRRVDVLVEHYDAQGCARGWTGEYLPARIADATAPINSILSMTPDAVEGETLTGRWRGDSTMDSPPESTTDRRGRSG